MRKAAAGAEELELDGRVVLLTGAGHAELVANLATKFEEGMLRPRPRVVELLEFAHGPFQEVYEESATFIAWSPNTARTA